MADATSIEWADATWNPVTGCTKVSAGCQHCYAERLMPRLRQKFTDVVLHWDRVDKPLHWKKPRHIFVNSMADLFHEKVPVEFLDTCFGVMAICCQHTFMILTKRPERAVSYIDEVNALNGIPNFPTWNVWLGVSVENQATADERIPVLLKTHATVRFVSYEPALGPVSFSRYLQSAPKGAPSRIDWLIAGGESGPNARPPHRAWFRSVRDECQEAGVPFFFKQWGEWRPKGVCFAPPSRCRWVFFNETSRDESSFPISVLMERVGKKRAGRLLDGREWNEVPDASK